MFESSRYYVEMDWSWVPKNVLIGQVRRNGGIEGTLERFCFLKPVVVELLIG